MKIKKYYFFFSLLLVLYLGHLNQAISSKIQVIVSIDDEIITDYDISKEENYLKILNPKLDNLNKSQNFELSKNSLIKEIIKKKEISQFIDLEKDLPIFQEYMENLASRLGYRDIVSLEKELLAKKTYSLNELKYKVKIEFYWNDLIYSKFNSSISINEKKIIEKIDKLKNENRKQLLLSEIVFNKKNDIKLEDLINEIKISIVQNGFDNTANLYSITESAKFGGNIGWVNENSLSNEIQTLINNLQINETSEVFRIGNNFIILKINDIKIIKKQIDKEKELKKLIQDEKNKKLEKMSLIYFNKAKLKYFINEK